MTAARCMWAGLTFAVSLILSASLEMRHESLHEQTRQEVDDDGAVVVVQRVPDLGLGEQAVEEVQVQVHDGPPLRWGVRVPRPAWGGDAEEHRRPCGPGANRPASRGSAEAGGRGRPRRLAP